MKSKLFSFVFFALTLCIFSAPAKGQEQKDENCRRLTVGGECVDMKLVLLGDGDPRQMPIILFNAPDVSEAQARELIQLFTPVLVKEFGQQIAIVTEERQIPRSWQGRRYVLTYRVRVSPVASTLEPVKTKKVAARKGAEFGRDMIDVLIQALPGNGRIASRAKDKAAEGAREVAQDQIDRAKLGQQGRDRTYAVTAELLRGDGSLFKAIKPTTKYFVVREVYNTQANRIDFYLVGEGDRRDQIVERDEPIYLGYTFDGSVEALTEQMFLMLLRQGGAVTRYLRDPERLDSVATNPAIPPPGFMPGCTELLWKVTEGTGGGRWVCKDQPAKAPATCASGRLVHDSQLGWRCVAEPPVAPLVEPTLRSAVGTDTPATPPPDPWVSCPPAQRRVEAGTGRHTCAAPPETVSLAGMAPVQPAAPTPAAKSAFAGFTPSTDFSPRSEGASRVNGFFCAGSGDHWFSAQWQSWWVPNVSGPNSKKAMGEFQATNGLSVSGALDAATLAVLDRLWKANPQLFPMMEELLAKSPQPCLVRPAAPKKPPKKK